MVCGRPSSVSVKSSLLRLLRILPCLSRTVANTLTTFTRTETVVADWAGCSSLACAEPDWFRGSAAPAARTAPAEMTRKQRTERAMVQNRGGNLVLGAMFSLCAVHREVGKPGRQTDRVTRE